MEMIAKLHDIDKDCVELFDDERKWLAGVVHIDTFDELGIAGDLFKGEVRLLVEVV